MRCRQSDRGSSSVGPRPPAGEHDSVVGDEKGDHIAEPDLDPRRSVRSPTEYDVCLIDEEKDRADDQRRSETPAQVSEFEADARDLDHATPRFRGAARVAHLTTQRNVRTASMICRAADM